MSRFLRIARGSATELEFHMLLARDLGFLAEDQSKKITGKVDETQRMLTALIERLEKTRKALSSRSHVVP